MEDNKGNEWAHVQSLFGRASGGGFLSLERTHQFDQETAPNCLKWRLGKVAAEDAVADTQALVKFLKKSPQGWRIRFLDFSFFDASEDEPLLPETAQTILGEFFASPDCRVEKVMLHCNSNDNATGTDILGVLAKYLPNSQTSIRKLVFSHMSFKTTKHKALLYQLLVGKQNFESLQFKFCALDPDDSNVSFLVDGLKSQNCLTHFRCAWSKHKDSEKWSEIFKTGVAPLSERSLSELEVYHPRPHRRPSHPEDGDETTLPEGLSYLLEMPNSKLRRLRLPTFLLRRATVPETVHTKCTGQYSQLLKIVKTTNTALHEVKFNSPDSFYTCAVAAGGDLDVCCQRNQLHTRVQKLLERPGLEGFVEELANLKEQPDKIGLFPIFALIRGRPDLVSYSFFQSLALFLTLEDETMCA